MQSDLVTIFPRQPVPALRAPLAGGGEFDISTERPQTFTLIIFYRGLHCPVCRTQLKDLESRLGAFGERGVSVVAISCDDKARAEETRTAWEVPNVRLGYGLPLSTARSWGLFVSRGRGKTSTGFDEPRLFAEPGIFLVRADGTLYFSSVQTMPFARPHLSDLLSAIDYVVKNDYPARGEVQSLADA